jgi:hypothetical protein
MGAPKSSQCPLKEFMQRSLIFNAMNGWNNRVCIVPRAFFGVFFATNANLASSKKRARYVIQIALLRDRNNPCPFFPFLPHPYGTGR